MNMVNKMDCVPWIEKVTLVNYDCVYLASLSFELIHDNCVYVMPSLPMHVRDSLSDMEEWLTAIVGSG